MSLNKQQSEVINSTKRREQLIVDINLERRKLDEVRTFSCLGSQVIDEV